MPKAVRKITYTTLFADESIHPKYEAAIKKFASTQLGRHHKMHIGAGEVSSAAGEFAHRSPIDTSIVVSYFPVGQREHARQAIEAAKRAFPPWSATPWRERVRIMRRAAELIDERKFEIAATITYEVGKNRLEALAEAWEAIDAIRLYTKVMEENKGYSKETEGVQGEHGRIIAKPLGVWPVISPFNFPFMLANGMATGAILTGNTVVLKPTSEAPLTGLMLYKVYRDAGVPAGAVNFVTGPGPNFSTEFTENPDVAGITFTGSRSVGLALYRDFLTHQPYVKPVLLELGSKNPAIVTANADLKKAVEGIVRAAYGYSGQKCSANSRVYVQSEVKDEFLQMLKKRLESVEVEDPREKSAFMGPVINEAAVKTFAEAVDQAKKDGGKIFFGGNVLTEGASKNGYYVQPTVVTGLSPDNPLFKRELFVPFLVVAEFKDLKQAIDEANDTDYGLTAGIFSEDKKEVAEFMDKIQFGVVYANRSGGATTGAWPGPQSFVGWKASGSTGKGIGGPSYLLTFLREQSQTVVS
ncbi:MAG TPA: aldehyde dehydrogenase family protein [Nitrososphaerales archaeon]|nr:aldehyde dehydrogenase family protein [Nitrososphaerales archaeon]